MLKDKKIVRRLALVLCLSLIVGLVPSGLLGAPVAVSAAPNAIVFSDDCEGTFAEKWTRNHTNVMYWQPDAGYKESHVINGKWVLLMQAYNSNNTLNQVATSKPIAIEAGKIYTLTYSAIDHWAYAGNSGNAADVKMIFTDANGATLSTVTKAATSATGAANWIERSVVAKAPENAVNLQIVFNTHDEVKDVLYLVDAIAVTETPDATPDEDEATGPVGGNALVNGDFENGTTGWKNAQVAEGAGKSGNALQLNAANVGKDIETAASDRVAVTPGKTYELSFYAKRDASDTDDKGYTAYLIWYDANGQLNNPDNGDLNHVDTWFSNISVNPGADWAQTKLVAEAPRGAATVAVRFYASRGTALNVYVDDIQFIEGTSGAPEETVPTTPTPTTTTPTAPAESGSVINGGFEDGLNNWGTNELMSVNTDDKHSGSASMQFAVTEEQGGRFVNQVISVIPGKTYNLVAWVKVLEGKGGYIGLYGIGGANAAYAFSGLTVGEWTEITVPVTVPYGYNAVEVEFGTNSKQVVTFLLDDIELIETDEPLAPTEPEVTVPTEPEGEKIYEDKFEDAFNPAGAAATVRIPTGWTASVHSAAIGQAWYDTFDDTKNLCIQDAKDKWIKSPLIPVTEGYNYTATYVEHKYQPNKKGAGGYAKIVFIDKDGNVLKEFEVEAGQTKIWEQGIILSKAPAGAVNMYVEFGLKAPTGEPTYSVDNLAVYAVEASLDDEIPTLPTEPEATVDPMKPIDEKFENPAEDDLNAGPADWISNDDSVDAFGTMISLVNNDLRYDGNYLRLGKIGTWSITSPEFPVQIGYAYTVKFMARKLMDNKNFNGVVEIVFVNTRGKVVETHTAVAGKTYGSWNEESLEAVAPIGAYKAYVVLRVENTGRNVDADFAVDNLTVTRAEEASFDYEQVATEPIIYNPTYEDTFTDSYNPEGSASTVRVPVGWTSSMPNSAAIGVGGYDKYEGTNTLFIQNKGDKYCRSDLHPAKAGYNYLVSYVEKKYQPHIAAEGGYMRIVFVDAAGNMVSQYEEEAGYSKTWTDMEFEYTAPAGAVNYYIEFGLKNCSGGDPTYGVDNLVVYESEKQVSDGTGTGGNGTGGTINPDNTDTRDHAALLTVSTILAAAVAMAVLVLKKRRFF